VVKIVEVEMASSRDRGNRLWGSIKYWNFVLNRVTVYLASGTYHVSMFKLNMVF
jgi:hypothetical protein